LANDFPAVARHDLEVGAKGSHRVELLYGKGIRGQRMERVSNAGMQARQV
jgi:hypothetical protein